MAKRHEQLAAAFHCWFCNEPLSVESVLADGILRSRSERKGGPYRLYACPACLKENLCETTKRGRWFASPPCRFSVLDYLFSRVVDIGAEDAELLLASLSWLQENEDRRRYFFEKDGDARYRHGSLLRFLWPAKFAPPQGARTRRAASSRPRVGAAGRAEAPRRPPRIIAPHEVLGVAPDASVGEIRARFRALALQYHPDKAAHLGAEFERTAHEKFLLLKQAYETLLAQRSLRREAP